MPMELQTYLLIGALIFVVWACIVVFLGIVDERDTEDFVPHALLGFAFVMFWAPLVPVALTWFVAVKVRERNKRIEKVKAEIRRAL